MSEPVKHDLTLQSASQHETWALCSCGWASGSWPTVVGAHLSFGKHIARASR